MTGQHIEIACGIHLQTTRGITWRRDGERGGLSRRDAGLRGAATTEKLSNHAARANDRACDHVKWLPPIQSIEARAEPVVGEW